MTGFTRMLLPLCQWLLMSIKWMTRFTCEYLPLISYVLLVSTKVHNRNYLWVFSTCSQSLTSSGLLVLHEPNMRVIFKFSQGTKCYSHFLQTWMWAILYGWQSGIARPCHFLLLHYVDPMQMKKCISLDLWASFLACGHARMSGF